MRATQTWLWTALITPFTADGKKVDFAALTSLIKQQEAAGNGILILGSTGESMSLSDDEKREVVRVTLALKTKTPIMVGVPNINIDQTLAWIDFCRGQNVEGQRVDAYLAATPAYTKPASHGQIAWFRAIFDAVDAPVMLYNVPSRTASSLCPKVLTALSSHKNFWAVKESSGTMGAFADYAAAAPNVALYSGDDPMLPSAVPMGACGLVSVAANVWPEACQSYVKSCREGLYQGQEWWNASKALFCTTSPIPLKALMQHRGMIASSSVRLPLSMDDLASLDGVIAADIAIAEWHKDYTSKEKAA